MVVVGNMNFKRVFFFFKHFIKFQWEIHYVKCSRQHTYYTAIQQIKRVRKR